MGAGTPSDTNHQQDLSTAAHCRDVRVPLSMQHTDDSDEDTAAMYPGLSSNHTSLGGARYEEEDEGNTFDGDAEGRDTNTAEDEQLLLPRNTHPPSPHPSLASSSTCFSSSAVHPPLIMSSASASSPYSRENAMQYPPLPTAPPLSPHSHTNGSHSKTSLTTILKDLLTGSTAAVGVGQRQARHEYRDLDSHGGSGGSGDDDDDDPTGRHVALDMGSSASPRSSRRAGQVDPEAEDLNERRCRICLETDDDKDSESGQLISPCLCKGSSRYIHLGCLQKWRDMSPRKESAFSCDTCHYHYSFSRPWMAHVLSHAWFLHIVTAIMFSTLCYGSAWCGRELDGHHIWEWKSHWMADPMDRARAVRVLGLDWMDVVWGFVMVAVMGLLFLLVSGCCCMFRGDDDDDADSNRCRNCGGCGSCAGPWYLGDCGGASGGEGLVLIMLVVALIVGIFGAFIGIYGIIARFNSRALDSMKETILEVK